MKLSLHYNLKVIFFKFLFKFNVFMYGILNIWFIYILVMYVIHSKQVILTNQVVTHIIYLYVRQAIYICLT